MCPGFGYSALSWLRILRSFQVSDTTLFPGSEYYALSWLRILHSFQDSKKAFHRKAIWVEFHRTPICPVPLGTRYFWWLERVYWAMAVPFPEPNISSPRGLGPVVGLGCYPYVVPKGTRGERAVRECVKVSDTPLFPGFGYSALSRFRILHSFQDSKKAFHRKAIWVEKDGPPFCQSL
jgi:hypothetical protein